MTNKVLVVDDEKLIVKGIKFSLEQDGMEVTAAYDGKEAYELAMQNDYDIILLDVMLPELNGFEVCQMIREKSDVPIIMLTAKGDDMDKILGLEYGADDYVTKPFNILEIKARIKAIIRRTKGRKQEQPAERTIVSGEMRIDLDSRRVFIGDREVNLTAKEFDLLETLMRNRGLVLTREKLLALTITPDSSMSASMSSGASDSGLSQLTGEDSGDEDTSFPLGDVAEVRETVSLNSIQRDQQRRCITVTAAIADGYNVTKVTSAVQQAVAPLALPEGVTVEFNGENEQIMDAMGQVMLMLLLGVVLVYLIMVAQFQSLKSPFIVMFTIPLAFTGGFMALLISGIEVSVISLIGFVMLVGIIVNNGIVLVDYINQQRLAGMARREAIIDAGVTRLRPILMTSLTTILGLIVTALAKNAGTALIQPIALVCIGGLLYATLMTLFVVPCMYDILSKKELRQVSEDELKLLDM